MATVNGSNFFGSLSAELQLRTIDSFDNSELKKFVSVSKDFQVLLSDVFISRMKGLVRFLRDFEVDSPHPSLAKRIVRRWNKVTDEMVTQRAVCGKINFKDYFDALALVEFFLRGTDFKNVPNLPGLLATKEKSILVKPIESDRLITILTSLDLFADISQDEAEKRVAQVEGPVGILRKSKIPGGITLTYKLFHPTNGNPCAHNVRMDTSLGLNFLYQKAFVELLKTNAGYQSSHRLSLLELEAQNHILPTPLEAISLSPAELLAKKDSLIKEVKSYPGYLSGYSKEEAQKYLYHGTHCFTGSVDEATKEELFFLSTKAGNGMINHKSVSVNNSGHVICDGVAYPSFNSLLGYIKNAYSLSITSGGIELEKNARKSFKESFEKHPFYLSFASEEVVDQFLRNNPFCLRISKNKKDEQEQFIVTKRVKNLPNLNSEVDITPTGEIIFSGSYYKTFDDFINVCLE